MLPQVVRIHSHFSKKYFNKVFQSFLSGYLKFLGDGRWGRWDGGFHSFLNLLPEWSLTWMTKNRIKVYVWSRFTKYFSFLFFFFVFLGPHLQYMEVPRLGVESELPCRPTLWPQQYGIWAMSMTYTTGHSSARSLTHWVRPGIKPVFLWILVGFINCWAMIGTPGFTKYFYMKNGLRETEIKYSKSFKIDQS